MKGKEFLSQIFRSGYLKTLFPSCCPQNSTRQLSIGYKTQVCTELCGTRDGLIVTRTRPRKDCSAQFPDGCNLEGPSQQVPACHMLCIHG